MASVFDKLNLKRQREIVVVNAPASFQTELATLHDVAVLCDVTKAETIEFGLAFASTRAEVDALASVFASKATNDAMLWFAYPKASSKRYRCDFNRDYGWDVLRKAGFDTVRQIAIDEDWSALRFRRVEHIKTSRNGSLTGKTTTPRRATAKS